MNTKRALLCFLLRLLSHRIEFCELWIARLCSQACIVQDTNSSANGDVFADTKQFAPWILSLQMGSTSRSELWAPLLCMQGDTFLPLKTPSPASWDGPCHDTLSYFESWNHRIIKVGKALKDHQIKQFPTTAMTTTKIHPQVPHLHICLISPGPAIYTEISMRKFNLSKFWGFFFPFWFFHHFPSQTWWVFQGGKKTARQRKAFPFPLTFILGTDKEQKKTHRGTWSLVFIATSVQDVLNEKKRK